MRSLLAYLALTRHRSAGASSPTSSGPRSTHEAQSRNLRVTLTYLLRVLEPDRAQRDASFFVRQDGGNLSLHPGESLAVDVWEFDALCERARDADRRGSPSAALDARARRRRAVAGRARPSWSPNRGRSPWSSSVGSASRPSPPGPASCLLAHGDTDAAHALAERALAIDPWLEAAHRLVVAAHRTTGDDLAARRALGRYREAIHDLGLGPDEATLMVERLLDSAAPGSSPLRAA